MKVLIFVFSVFALTKAAIPWYSSHSMASEMANQKPGIKDVCQSATFTRNKFTTYVNICERGTNKHCFFSNGVCCDIQLDDPSPPTPKEQYKILFSNEVSSTVNFYTALGGQQGSCYVIGNKEILPCQGCQVGECTEPVCEANTLNGDSARDCTATTCKCKSGYAPDFCCECDVRGIAGPPHYKDPDTKECTPFCRNCLERSIDGCIRCAEGYSGRDCCSCADGYFKDNQGICRKVFKCQQNVDRCTDEGCTCKLGYSVSSECCECIPGYVSDTPDQVDKTCRVIDPPECEANVNVCANGVCTCKPGYMGSNCCLCDQDYIFDTACPMDKRCKVPRCKQNVVSCFHGECTCKLGYSACSECCDCLPGYVSDPKVDNTCRSI